jgi:hypothetical protein
MRKVLPEPGGKMRGRRGDDDFVDPVFLDGALDGCSRICARIEVQNLRMGRRSLEKPQRDLGRPS